MWNMLRGINKVLLDNATSIQTHYGSNFLRQFGMRLCLLIILYILDAFTTYLLSFMLRYLLNKEQQFLDISQFRNLP